MKSIHVNATTNAIAFFFAAMFSNLVAAPYYGDAVQFENIETSTSTTIHGACGSAYITISGIDSNNPTIYGGLNGSSKSTALNTSDPYVGSQVRVTVIVGQPGKSRQKSTTISLEEASTINCIATKSGKMVVVGTECRGNVGGCYNPNYFVINAEKITNTDTKKVCDTKCANHKLGGPYIKARE